ncbi:hypothetical protein N431DRAFT_57118 [Stipitochalara longipes BDJ]|nr:hypothetical protein N431DRAFT_57118 [Stipitochalara longipes BDJ]
MEELHKTAATPPLKELADSGYFKFQALQRRELRKETLNERRQVQLDTLRGIEVAQQYGQQVMSAFNGARGQISPTVPRNVHNPPPISPTTVLNTFSTEDRTRFQSWFHSLAPQQKHQLMAHLRSLDAMGQWQVFADCCRPGFAANDIANPQAMATLVENLSPSQRQFMMQNTSPSTRGLMSPMIGGDSFGPSQMINNGTAGSNHQRSLSDGNRLSALQPSAQTTFSTTGASNTQQVGAAAHGHQRRASYTGLPPPSPKTLVNFGEAIDGQSNRLPGPGGDPLFASMGNQEMPGNFHRTTSTLQPAGMMMHNANLSPNFPPNGWSMNSPGGSPSIQQSSFNSGTPASNYQQIPPSNANLMPHFPAMVAYGAESSNNRRGPPMNGPGGSPPMQPSILDESLAIEPWVVNDPYQSPLSNNGNHIAPLQTPTNKQSVQVIKLTKSGGIIGPTTIPTSSNCLAPANTIPTHRQISSSHQPTRSISGPGSCPANHTPGMGNSIARSHPPGSSPLTSAPIHGLGIFNGLMMIGSANSNDPSSHFGALKPPQQAQTNALQASVAFPIPRVSALESNSNTSAPHPASRPFTLDHQSHAHPYPPVLRHAHTAPPNSGNMAPPHPEFRRTFSQSDARNSPQFQKLLFCRGCPWRQIDITKARICEGCKADKLKIITHRHFVFGPLHRGVAFELGEGVGHGQLANTNARTCMVCTGLATTKCVDCPLRLCTSCQVTLSSQCKSPSPFFTYCREIG